MRVTTAKELKNRTGEILRRVSLGDKVLITRRGRPVALLCPPTQAATPQAAGLRPASKAWAAIEARLKAMPPEFPTWRAAMRWSRRRA